MTHIQNIFEIKLRKMKVVFSHGLRLFLIFSQKDTEYELSISNLLKMGIGMV